MCKRKVCIKTRTEIKNKQKNVLIKLGWEVQEDGWLKTMRSSSLSLELVLEDGRRQDEKWVTAPMSNDGQRDESRKDSLGGWKGKTGGMGESGVKIREDLLAGAFTNSPHIHTHACTHAHIGTDTRCNSFFNYMWQLLSPWSMQPMWQWWQELWWSRQVSQKGVLRREWREKSVEMDSRTSLSRMCICWRESTETAGEIFN